MRINTGFVKTVLAARGGRVDDDEALRRLLGRLDEAESVKLRGVLDRMNAGVESAEDTAVINSMRAATTPEARDALRAVGASGRSEADVMRWLLAGGSVDRMREAARGNEGAVTELKGGLGSDGPAGVATEAGRREATKDATGSAAADRLQRGQRRRRLWADDDRAKSFARDEDAVKALPASKHQVFTAKVGATFEIDLLRTPEHKRRFTVRVEGAERGEDGQGVDWVNKIVVQLDASELHQAAAVFFGAAQSFVAKHHGVDKDKSIEVRRQAGGLMVRVSQTGKAVAVPVDAEHLYKVALLFGRALHLNDPDVDMRCLIDTLRLTSAIGAAS